jgi:UDP-GlcNAc:undecaprenyl-phosphate GlcNAc-1-phosphate transferase
MLSRLTPLALAAVAFGFGVLFCVLLTAGLRRVLLASGSVDLPRADRWHSSPVPRPGGPAIVATVLLGIGVLLPHPWSPEIVGLIVGGLCVFGVGLLDDIVDLPNTPKLTMLILVAVVPLFFGIRFRFGPPLIAVPLALLWILGVTNAVNWLDNMDGLTAGVGAIAATTVAVLALSWADPVGGILGALVAGACGGFLYFNRSPARIFMGDSGSGFLGFTLAVLALAGTAAHVRNVLLAVIVPALVLSVPIFDTAIVTMSRTFHGRRLFQGGRDHPSHRLVVLGLSERSAVFVLWGLSALSAAVAIVTAGIAFWTGIAFSGVLACAFAALGLVLLGVHVYQEPAPGVVPEGRVVLWPALYKLRMLAILLDLILMLVAYAGAYLLKFEGTIPATQLQEFSFSLPLIVAVKLTIFYLSGLYRTDWRYIGSADLVRVVRASALASVAVVAALYLWTGLVNYSRAIFVLDWILATALLGGLRLSVRTLREYFQSRQARDQQALIFGAGEGGVLLLQELRANPALPYRAVGFIDDDPLKRGVMIRGLRVLGTRRDLPGLVARHNIDAVLMAVPSLSTAEAERVELACQEAGVVCHAMRAPLVPLE